MKSILRRQRRLSNIFLALLKNRRKDISYDRTNPGLITAPIGYFDGAAGIITALLQLYIFENPENNEEPHIYAMIDDPYNDVKNM